eukprot:TRINITY_DN56323_c0_g1_i1.p1 TRINITY_DN56323_c0_g1~~TRINITY_DN56323_c0_g1_i1.p1  ORF type:complete len:407 (+),score=41.07 TRINITY_DN56323_c0_g1_i1:234-1454(+)
MEAKADISDMADPLAAVERSAVRPPTRQTLEMQRLRRDSVLSMTDSDEGGDVVAPCETDCVVMSPSADVPDARRRSTMPAGEMGRRPGVEDEDRSSVRSRLHEAWDELGGRNQVLCGGRLITGPRSGNCFLLLSWCFVLVPGTMYFTRCSAYLWEASPLLPFTSGFCMLCTMLFLSLTSFTEPGIVPRYALQRVVPGLPEEVARVTGCEAAVVDPLVLEPECILSEAQKEAGYKWCNTCLIVRPPRAAHCRDCDNCVMHYDHHCPWVNNCIGRRNYVYFTALLWSVSGYGWSVIAGSCMYLNDHGGFHLGDHHVKTDHAHFNPLIILLVGASLVLLALALAGLTVFHVYLAFRGQTTKEMRSGSVIVSREDPAYSSTLCTSRGPSLINGRTMLMTARTVSSTTSGP